MVDSEMCSVHVSRHRRWRWHQRPLTMNLNRVMMCASLLLLVARVAKHETAGHFDFEFNVEMDLRGARVESGASALYFVAVDGRLETRLSDGPLLLNAGPATDLG